MKTGASSNIDDVTSAIDGLLPRRPSRAQLRNSMEYARPLHAKHGFYIFNDQHFLRTARRALRGLVNSTASLTRRNVNLALEAACLQEINFLRSATGELRPPAPRNAAGRYIPVAERGEPRDSHPGGWSDITGNLANAYSHDVT